MVGRFKTEIKLETRVNETATHVSQAIHNAVYFFEARSVYNIVFVPNRDFPNTKKYLMVVPVPDHRIVPRSCDRVRV